MLQTSRGTQFLKIAKKLDENVLLYKAKLYIVNVFFSRVLFICIAYLLYSYYTVIKYRDEIDDLKQGLLPFNVSLIRTAVTLSACVNN